MDIAKHRYFMMQVLLAIFRNKELSELQTMPQNVQKVFGRQVQKS